MPGRCATHGATGLGGIAWRAESEAISLALELTADYLLIDDKAARRLAVALRINVIGTLGLLVKAKNEGLLPTLRSKLDALRTLPFHIAPALYDDILASVGEADSR
jgi:predicted nucleic acid-binding protein